MKNGAYKSLLGQLKRLVDASEAGNFNVALAVDDLAGEEQEAARLLVKVLKNYQAAMEYGLAQYRITGKAPGTTLRGDPPPHTHSVGVADAPEGITTQKYTRKNLCETEERVKIMLAAFPFSLIMWDKNFEIIDCSQSAVDTLGFSDKQELIDRFASCAPKYQPNGRRSLDMLAEEMTAALCTGFSRQEWTHMTAGGDSIVFDMRFVRVNYRDEHALMLYARDIREDKRISDELARRDDMLVAQAHWYKSILDAIPIPLSVSDADMNLAFINASSAKFFDKSRDELIGQPCRCWNIPICNTASCSVVRMKRGLKQTFFKYNGLTCQIDTEVIRDLAGNTVGFIEILHNVTEIENMARRQAEEVSEAKNVFLATMSHEMRTPLNAVIGLSELTLDGGGLSEETESNLEKIYNAGSTLLSIVNDILDFSKIRSGKFEIIPNEYDVSSMVNDAIAQNLLRIGNKPVQFDLDINADIPARLYGDDLRIKQIINNLLSNAFKYTEKGAVGLGLHCEREGETVWMTIRVSDTGVGIRPEYRDRLFSDYSQFDVKANRKVGGSGLGLSITKSLAEMMEGGITVESTFGKGSVFTVKLRQQPVDDTVIGVELAENLKSFRYSTSKRGINARLQRVKLPYARVLVVDDHVTNLDVAKGLMRPYGMQIDCVTGGQEAIDAIREEKVRYSAIFMDHMMPVMDGIEATRRIREIGTKYAVNIPVIALTANALVGSEEMFLRNSFQAFISKPIEMMRLDEVIRRFVRDKAQEALPDQGTLNKRKRRDRRGGQERRSGEDRRAVGSRSEFGLMALGKKIEGLDISEGLKYFGNEESLMEVLRSYVLNTKPLLESIKIVEREGLAGYAIIVHGIKGSSRGICAEPVGHLAAALESAAKSGDFDFVRDNSPAFVESVWKLVESIETMLDDIEKIKRKPKREKPDSGLLAQLQTACKVYDLDGIDAMMQEIEKYEYTADDGLIEWLRDAIARLNYTQIVQKLTNTEKS